MTATDSSVSGSEAAVLAEQLPSGELHLGDALRAAALFIKRFQPESPRLEAEIIIGEIWRKSPEFLFAHPETLLPSSVWDTARLMIARRCLGEPIAYITGRREFFGHTFLVTPAVLIPRPETELLVEAAINELSARQPSEPADVLDLCTGSGNIAVSIALAIPRCRVWAQDISAAALEVAQANVRNYRLQDRLTLLGGDLFSQISPAQKFAVITANPPYIGRDSSLPADPNVQRFEPELALYSGQDGLDVIRSIVRQAPHHLLPGGKLFMEIGCNQGEEVRQILLKAGLEEVQITQDLQNLPRIASCRFNSSQMGKL